MSRPKEERWYELDGGELRIFNHPDPARASAGSVTSPSDLTFYRRNFRLRKVEVASSGLASDRNSTPT